MYLVASLIVAAKASNQFCAREMFVLPGAIFLVGVRRFSDSSYRVVEWVVHVDAAENNESSQTPSLCDNLTTGYVVARACSSRKNLRLRSPNDGGHRRSTCSTIATTTPGSIQRTAKWEPRSNGRFNCRSRVMTSLPLAQKAI